MLKTIKISIFVLIALSLLNSCSGIMRLTETKSYGKDSLDYNVFENQDLKITYNFWSENGTMNFTIHNKSQEPLYIDWKKSAFILNDLRNVYWIEKTITENVSVIRPTGPAAPYRLSTSTYIPERISILPPNSYINSPTSFPIYKKVYVNDYSKNYYNSVMADNLEFDKEAKRVKIQSSTGKGYVDAIVRLFEYENSPLKFRNYITYSKKEDFTDSKSIDNEFFVQKYTQMSDINFFGKYNNTYSSNNTNQAYRNQSFSRIVQSPYMGGLNFYTHIVLMK